VPEYPPVASYTLESASLPPVKLRVLHLEDNDEDHALVAIHLRRGGINADIERVDNEVDLTRALNQEWDLILSDYNLPGYSGLAALDKVRSMGKLVPFILVSGEIGEDIAVQAMRNGANDYLLKSNLARLAPAALLAIEANRTRIAKQRADLALSRSRQQLRELAQHLQTSIEQERAAIAREIHAPGTTAAEALKRKTTEALKKETQTPVTRTGRSYTLDARKKYEPTQPTARKAAGKEASRKKKKKTAAR